MIRVNGKYDLPSEWEELTSEQYLAVMECLGEFEAGRTSFEEMKVRTVLALTGISRPDPENVTLCENIFRLSERLTFPYRFRYDEPRFGKLSAKMQEALAKRLPSQMDPSEPEVRVALSFRPKVEADLSFAKQMLPVLPGTGMEGYTFIRKGPIVETSLTAAQYIDANSMLRMLHGDSEDRDIVLNSLVSILYAPKPYDPDREDCPRMGGIPYHVKLAVMYNFISVAEWVSRMPQYDLLFNTAKRKSAGTDILSPDAALMSLSEKGYGDYAAVGRMNLFTYLNILLKQTVDAVREMKAYKVKPGEIAEKMNLTLEQISAL